VAPVRPKSQEPGVSMFGPIGMPELIIILVIALIVFGPRKLPDLGRSLGRSLSEFKRASSELRSTLEDEIRVEEKQDQPGSTSANTTASTSTTSETKTTSESATSDTSANHTPNAGTGV